MIAKKPIRFKACPKSWLDVRAITSLKQ